MQQMVVNLQLHPNVKIMLVPCSNSGIWREINRIGRYSVILTLPGGSTVMKLLTVS